MSSPKWSLDGVTEKLARAKENISNIENQVALILGPDTHRVITNENHDAIKEFLDAHFARKVPPRLSVLAAECIHNLRSCLDQLAWQLVIANNARPGRSNCFPLFITDPTGDEKATATYEGCVKGMSATAKAYILALQPYHPGNGGRDHVLRVIHDLNITDKHHELVIVKNSMRTHETHTFKPVLSAGLNTFTLSETEHGAITHNRSVTLKPVKVDKQIVIQIAFAQLGQTRLEPVTDGLWKLRAAVERVVYELAGEFPTP